MSHMYIVLLFLVVFACIGILISLPQLALPLRRFSQRSVIARMSGIAVFTLLAFMAGLAVGKWLTAGYLYGLVTAPSPGEYGDLPSTAIMSELVIRGMIPPPLRISCYTQDQLVCQWADWAIESWEFQTATTLKLEGLDPPDVEAWSDWNSWQKYLDWSFWCSLIPATTSGICAWLFTRPRRFVATFEDKA